MKTVSIRDLRYDFKTVERMLREGEEISITRRRKVIARLLPEPQPARELPDFMGRLRTIHGDACALVSGTDLVRLDRDRY